MKLELNLEVLQECKDVTINLNDYDITEEEFKAMDKYERTAWLWDNVVIEFDAPEWVVANVKEL